jgi:hypothetical protein
MEPFSTHWYSRALEPAAARLRGTSPDDLQIAGERFLKLMPQKLISSLPAVFWSVHRSDGHPRQVHARLRSLIGAV